MIYLHQIDPIAIRLPEFELLGKQFHLQVHWYGIMYLLAFATAWWLGRRRVNAGRLPGINFDQFTDLLFYGMLGVVLGGRLGYVFFYDLSAFLHSPAMIFKVWEGGMSFHGGLLGVMIACGLWVYKQKLNFFDTMDFAAPLVPLGLGLGRIGNFIGDELWGKFTQANWGVIFPTGLPEQLKGLSAQALQAQYATGVLDQYARHPSQLYEAFLEGLVLFVVLWLYSSKPRPRYAVSGLFALLYGIFRFSVEFVRVPDNGIYMAFDWLTWGQFYSIPLIIGGAYLLWLSQRAPTVQPVLPKPAS